MIGFEDESSPDMSNDALVLIVAITPLYRKETTICIKRKYPQKKLSEQKMHDDLFMRNTDTSKDPRIERVVDIKDDEQGLCLNVVWNEGTGIMNDWVRWDNIASGQDIYDFISSKTKLQTPLSLPSFTPQSTIRIQGIQKNGETIFLRVVLPNETKSQLVLPETLREQYPSELIEFYEKVTRYREP